MNKWDDRFIQLAEHVASWSKDPSTQVGAVVSQGKKIVSVGFNGLPPEMEDTPKILNNRELKYQHIIHGEINAMNFAEKSIHGCTLYVWPFMPCSKCAKIVVERGIARVVAPHSENPRWIKDFELSTMILNLAGIELILINQKD